MSGLYRFDVHGPEFREASECFDSLVMAVERSTESMVAVLKAGSSAAMIDILITAIERNNTVIRAANGNATK